MTDPPNRKYNGETVYASRIREKPKMHNLLQTSWANQEFPIGHHVSGSGPFWFSKKAKEGHVSREGSILSEKFQTIRVRENLRQCGRV